MMRIFGNEGDELKGYVDMNQWMPFMESNTIKYHFPEREADVIGYNEIVNGIGGKDLKSVNVYPKFTMYSLITFQKTHDGKDLMFVIYKLTIRESIENSFTIKFGYNDVYFGKKKGGLLDIILPFLSYGIKTDSDFKMTLFNRTRSVEGMVVLEYLNDIIEGRVFVGEDNRFGFYIDSKEKEKVYDKLIRDCLYANRNWEYQKGDYSPEPSPSQT